MRSLLSGDAPSWVQECVTRKSCLPDKRGCDKAPKHQTSTGAGEKFGNTRTSWRRLRSDDAEVWSESTHLLVQGREGNAEIFRLQYHGRFQYPTHHCRYSNSRQVVDADSAKIGDAREEVGSIPANHSEMTKFESSDDIGFKRISAQLRRWVQELRGDETISKEDIVSKS